MLGYAANHWVYHLSRIPSDSNKARDIARLGVGVLDPGGPCLGIWKLAVQSQSWTPIEPLAFALSENCHLLFEMLIENGHDPVAEESTMNDRYQSLLGMAIESKDSTPAKFLLEHGISAKKPIYSGRISPIELATQYGNWEIVKILTQNGADTTIRKKTKYKDDCTYHGPILALVYQLGLADLAEILSLLGESVNQTFDIFGSKADDGTVATQPAENEPGESEPDEYEPGKNDSSENGSAENRSTKNEAVDHELVKSEPSEQAGYESAENGPILNEPVEPAENQVDKTKPAETKSASTQTTDNGIRSPSREPVRVNTIFHGTLLFLKTTKRNLPAVVSLLDAGADPEVEHDLRLGEAGYCEATGRALHSAILLNHLELVEVLLSHGANPNATCRLQRNDVIALNMTAASSGLWAMFGSSVWILEALLKRGALCNFPRRSRYCTAANIKCDSLESSSSKDASETWSGYQS